MDTLYIVDNFRGGSIMADNNPSLLEEMINLKDSLPKRQRYLCDFILKNYFFLD